MVGNMYFKATICLVILACLSLGTEAQRRPRGKADRTMYKWQTDIGDGVLIYQWAIVNSDANYTIVITNDKELKENNLTMSVMYYDSTGMMAIKKNSKSRKSKGRGFRRPPCFLTSTDTPYEILATLLGFIDDTNYTLPVNVQDINGTSPPLSREEVRELYQTNPSLARFCRGSPIINTTESTGGPDDDTQVKSTLSLEGQINILMPMQPPTPPRRRPPFPFPFPFPRSGGNGNPFPFPRPRPGGRSGGRSGGNSGNRFNEDRTFIAVGK